MPVKCICKYCGGDFETFPAEIKKGGGKFCCPEHYHLWVSENKTKSGQNSNLWKGATVDLICKQCGITYPAYKSQIKWRGSSFCSRDCRALWHSKNKEGKDSWNWIDKVKCICEICGTEFEKQRSDVKRYKGVYCSNKCKGIAKIGEKNPNWHNGSSFGKYCPKFNRPFKENVRNFFNQTCMICDHVWQPGETKLAVHHVYYNKKSCCEETEEGHYIHTLPEGVKVIVKGNPNKFVPVCPNGCHAKTNHNRLQWALFFEELINTKYSGWSYTPPTTQ